MISNQEDTSATDNQDKTSDANNNNNEYVETNLKNTSTSSDPDKKPDSTYNYIDEEQSRKIFIGYPKGLSMSEETFAEYFSKFGTVDKVIIKRDVITSQPRGFGFLTMSKPEEINAILEACPIEIKGKQVEVKLAKSRPISKKVFVGGIDSNLTREQIIDYFKIFGNVEDLELPIDRLKKKRREFCFVIFDTEDAAEAASRKAKQTIHGRECDVKKATPQPIAQQQKRQNLQQSFNSTQSHQFSNLNHSRNTKNFYSSPIPAKNNSNSYGTYRGYRGTNNNKNQFNRTNTYTPSGRKSVDSHYGTIYEYGNSSGRKNGQSLNRQTTNQYLQSTVTGQQQNSTTTTPNSKTYNNHHKQHQQYAYDQLSAVQQQQNYYATTATGYPSVPGYGYDYSHQNYAAHQPNTANNQAYMQNHLDYYNNPQYYQQYYQNQPIPQYQQANTPANHLYTNYQSANSLDNQTIAALPQTTPSAADSYQILEEQYYQEQQKLMNNPNYDKFDQQETFQQPINSNLLNVQQYQNSIQQC